MVKNHRVIKSGTGQQHSTCPISNKNVEYVQVQMTTDNCGSASNFF